jgi:hypothetical protein
MMSTFVKLFVPSWGFSTDEEKILERRNILQQKYKNSVGFKKVEVKTEMVKEVQPLQYYLLGFNSEENAYNFAKEIYRFPLDYRLFIIKN